MRHVGARRGASSVRGSKGSREQPVDLLGSQCAADRRSPSSATRVRPPADAIPIADALVPFLENALSTSSCELVFPDADGNMRSEEADPQKVLRTAPHSRARLVDYWLHSCRRCKRRGAPHGERHADDRLRTCPHCGMKVWASERVRAMRFHDLRHTTATLLLREPVDAHRVLRHRDIKTTAGIYGHLVVEDLREAINLLPQSPFAASLLEGPASNAPAVQNPTFDNLQNQGFALEREARLELATLSLGS